MSEKVSFPDNMSDKAIKEIKKGFCGFVYEQQKWDFGLCLSIFHSLHSRLSVVYDENKARLLSLE